MVQAIRSPASLNMLPDPLLRKESLILLPCPISSRPNRFRRSRNRLLLCLPIKFQRLLSISVYPSRINSILFHANHPSQAISAMKVVFPRVPFGLFQDPGRLIPMAPPTFSAKGPTFRTRFPEPPTNCVSCGLLSAIQSQSDPPSKRLKRMQSPSTAVHCPSLILCQSGFPVLALYHLRNLPTHSLSSIRCAHLF